MYLIFTKCNVYASRCFFTSLCLLYFWTEFSLQLNMLPCTATRCVYCLSIMRMLDRHCLCVDTILCYLWTALFLLHWNHFKLCLQTKSFVYELTPSFKLKLKFYIRYKCWHIDIWYESRNVIHINLLQTNNNRLYWYKCNHIKWNCE